MPGNMRGLGNKATSIFGRGHVDAVKASQKGTSMLRIGSAKDYGLIASSQS